MSKWLILLFLILGFISCDVITPPPPTEAQVDATDDFGGWEDKQSATITTVNRNADGSAYATSVTPTTLTDSTKNWAVNSLQGYNLQPNVATHMYFEIISNTATTVTVLESDRTGGDYRGVDDYNDGDDEYRILNDWVGEKVDGRYYRIDPQDNVWLANGINNFWDGSGNNGIGVDPHGHSLPSVLSTKYGASEPNERFRLVDLKSYHFNVLMEYVNPALYPGADSDVTSEYYMPYLHLIRPNLYWEYTDLEVPPGNIFFDAFDPDFATNMRASLEGTFDTFSDMGATQQSYNITPYKAGWKNCAASPYCMGLKLEDEPSSNLGYSYDSSTGKTKWSRIGGGGNINHGMYNPAFFGFVNRLRNINEVSETKAFFVNVLRSLYSEGGESTFLANIAFEGSDEVTLYSNWSSVPGYVSSAKDAAALANLNAAWSPASYASWEEVYKNDNSDPADTKTGSSNISFNNTNPDTITISGGTWDFSPDPHYIKISGSANNNGIFEIKNDARITFGWLPSYPISMTAGTTTLSLHPSTSYNRAHFTSSVVGSYLYITGTNFVTGYYQVTGYTDEHTVTLASDATNGSNATGTATIDNVTPTAIVLESSESLTAELNTSATLSTIGEIYSRVKTRTNANITNINQTGDCCTPYTSVPPQIMLDFDQMSEYFWRRYYKTFSDWFDDRFYDKKILTTMKANFAQYPREKTNRWYGSHSEDYSKKYLDVIVAYGDYDPIGVLSAITDTPVWVNSYWHDGGLDSPRGTSGTVDEVRYTLILHGVTDASGNTGKNVIDTNVSDTVIDDRPSTYAPNPLTAYIKPNACSGDTGQVWCGTVFCNTTADPDVCSDVAFYGNRAGGVAGGAQLPASQIVLKDEGVTGNSINYELRSYNVLYDADASTVDAWPHTYYYRRLWWSSGAEKSLTARDFSLGTNPARMSCRFTYPQDGSDGTELAQTNYCQGGYYTCENTTGRTCYGYRCINLNHWLPAGTEYTIATGNTYWGCPNSKLMNMTQEERGQNFYDSAMARYNYKNTDGDYYFIGQSWFNIWDVGSGYNENINFGWFTVSDNEYDGVEATQLGADGIASTEDDEMADYGNFTGKAKEFTQYFYQLLNPSEEEPQVSGAAFTGSIFFQGAMELLKQ